MSSWHGHYAYRQLEICKHLSESVNKWGPLLSYYNGKEVEQLCKR
jgi:hypothetical protein